MPIVKKHARINKVGQMVANSRPYIVKIPVHRRHKSRDLTIDDGMCPEQMYLTAGPKGRQGVCKGPDCDAFSRLSMDVVGFARDD